MVDPELPISVHLQPGDCLFHSKWAAVFRLVTASFACPAGPRKAQVRRLRGEERAERLAQCNG